MVAVTLGTVCGMQSCDEVYYEEELYRKEIYLVSGDNNIFEQEYYFGGDKGSLSIYAGGTTPLEHDVEVVLVHDQNSLTEYNQRNFAQDYDSYARELSPDRYSIEDMSIILKGNSQNPYALCDISVNTDGLSPDETYFIPLRIESVSDYMASKSKNFVLYQVHMKNDYATTKKDTYYTMTGTSQAGTMSGETFSAEGSSQAIYGSKLVVPVSSNAIRMMPGAKQTTDAEQLRNWGISVTVDPIQTVDVPVLEDGEPTGEFVKMKRVTLTPYIDSQIAVQLKTVPGKDCAYDPETETFYLYYRYHVDGERLNDADAWYEIAETMKSTNY